MEKAFSIRRPSISMIRSPALNPALSAGLPLSDTLNQFAMFGANVLVTKTQFHRRLPVVSVHPKGGVKNGGSGKERCQSGQQRFGER